MSICFGQALEAKAELGMSINSSSGDNVFMEEILDEEEVEKQKEELNKPRPINRRPLTPGELSNVGVQMTPSGAIVPLIKRNAPPVQIPSSEISTTFEVIPAIPVIPYNMTFFPNRRFIRQGPALGLRSFNYNGYIWPGYSQTAFPPLFSPAYSAALFPGFATNSFPRSFAAFSLPLRREIEIQSTTRQFLPFNNTGLLLD